jgi:hypothetical protein
MGRPMGREAERITGFRDGGVMLPPMNGPSGRSLELVPASPYAASLIGSTFGRGLRDACHKS